MLVAFLVTHIPLGSDATVTDTSSKNSSAPSPVPFFLITYSHLNISGGCILSRWQSRKLGSFLHTAAPPSCLLCCAVPCCAMLCHDVPCHVIPCHAMSYRAMLCNADTRHMEGHHLPCPAQPSQPSEPKFFTNPDPAMPRGHPGCSWSPNAHTAMA